MRICHEKCESAASSSLSMSRSFGQKQKWGKAYSSGQVDRFDDSLIYNRDSFII